MTIEELIYDIKEIEAALEDDSELEDPWLLHKINNYRAAGIAEQYEAFPVVDPSWLQSIPLTTTEQVKASDDPSVTEGSIDLSRVTLPEVISLPEDMGVYRLSGSGGIIGFEPTDYDTLVMKALVGEPMAPSYGYYARIGLFAYIYPQVMEVKANIIAADPTSVQIYTGSEYRDFTVSDQYPIDPRMAQMIILKILTVDLKLNEQAVLDLVNDSQVPLKVMKDGTSKSKSN